MNLRLGLVIGMLLAGAFVGTLPTATAQGAHCAQAALVCQTTTTLSITPRSELVKPLGPFVIFPITVTYTFNPEVPLSLGTTQIALTVTGSPSWAVAILTPGSVYAPVNQLAPSQEQVTVSMPAFLQVSATADAPAFQSDSVQVTASAAVNGGLLPSSDTTSVPIQAAFFSIIEATAESQIQKAKPQAQVAYPITVTNFGNALTKVNFDVTAVADKFQVSLPTPITLESRQAGGQQNSRTVNFNIQSPYWNGYLNVVGVINLKLTSNYALDPAVVGDTTIVSTLTTTKGFYVPGFEPILILMGVGALAVAMRKRPPGEPPA